MTIEKALEIIKGIECTLGCANIMKEPLQVAMRALEKQIPQKVIQNKRCKELGKCPICNTELCIDDEDLHYCPTCGQALEVKNEYKTL